MLKFHPHPRIHSSFSIIQSLPHTNIFRHHRYFRNFESTMSSNSLTRKESGNGYFLRSKSKPATGRALPSTGTRVKKRIPRDILDNAPAITRRQATSSAFQPPLDVPDRKTIDRFIASNRGDNDHKRIGGAPITDSVKYREEVTALPGLKARQQPQTHAGPSEATLWGTSETKTDPSE